MVSEVAELETIVVVVSSVFDSKSTDLLLMVVINNFAFEKSDPPVI